LRVSSHWTDAYPCFNEINELNDVKNQRLLDVEIKEQIFRVSREASVELDAAEIN